MDNYFFIKKIVLNSNSVLFNYHWWVFIVWKGGIKAYSVWKRYLDAKRSLYSGIAALPSFEEYELELTFRFPRHTHNEVCSVLANINLKHG